MEPIPEGDPTQAVKAGLKLFDDLLPDIMLSMETVAEPFVSASEIYGQRIQETGTVADMGSVGVAVADGLYVLSDSVHAAWDDAARVLNSHRAFQQPWATKYLSTPRTYLNAGILAESEGCPSQTNETDDLIQIGFAEMLKYNFSCVESWWLSPACAALGDKWRDECVAVLDDDWGYLKPAMYQALAETNMRVAKLTLGYDAFYEVIRSRQFNVSFLWWSTDTQFIDLDPRLVHLPEEIGAVPEIPLKIAWKSILAGRQQLELLLRQIRLNIRELDGILKLVRASQTEGNGPTETDQPGFFQKLACDWLQANPSVWQKWLPNANSCNDGEVFNTTSNACDLCKEGSYVSGGVCAPCEAGRFQALPRQLLCEECKEGTASLQGALQCDACPQGKFSNGTGSSQCVRCPARMTTRTALAAHKEQCVCEDGSHFNGSACAPCMLGLICPGGFAPLRLDTPDKDGTVSVGAGFMATYEGLQSFKCLKGADDRCKDARPVFVNNSFNAAGMQPGK